jgi:hypothetical protein
LGDPVRADFCAGIKYSAFGRWGDAGPDVFQRANYCYIDVDLSPADSFGIDVHSIYQDQQVTRPDFTAKTLTGGYQENVYPVSGADCLRVLHIGAIEIEIGTGINAGHVPSSTLCGGADEMVKQALAAYTHGPVPARALALPTITNFDLCALTRAAHFERLPDFTRDVGGDDQFDEGGICSVSTATLNMQVSFVFPAVDYDFGTDAVTIAGHRLYRSYFDDSTDGGACYFDSVQGLTTDRAYHEVLEFEMDGPPSATGNSLCPTLEKFAVAVLDAAQLH